MIRRPDLPPGHLLGREGGWDSNASFQSIPWPDAGSLQALVSSWDIWASFFYFLTISKFLFPYCHRDHCPGPKGYSMRIREPRFASVPGFQACLLLGDGTGCHTLYLFVYYLLGDEGFSSGLWFIALVYFPSVLIRM